MTQDEDNNEKLWELLGKARKPSVSPFFARNVLRAVRQEAEPASGLDKIRLAWSRLFRRWSWRLAVAAVCLAGAVISVLPLPRVHRHGGEITAPAGKFVENSDYEVIKNLDELAADEENSVWLDDSVN